MDIYGGGGGDPELEAVGGVRGNRNLHILKGIEERWETDRTESANKKKMPLLPYDEWIPIDRAIGQEVGAQNAIGESGRK